MSEVTINRENYEKFIQLASHMSGSGDDENFTFGLEALARIVDVAYCEGQIAELTIDEKYAEDPNKIARLGALQTQIDNAYPESFVEVVSEEDEA